MADNNIIGFVGSDKYEVLLYLSRILYNLDKKVLLVDYCESKALTCSIPIPMTLKETSSYLDYRGIDFIKGENYSLNMNKDYDYVLIDFGFNNSILSRIRCDNIVYVTDLQLHNAKRIKVKHEQGKPKRYLIIKDAFTCKITVESILLEINPKAPIDSIYIVEQDALDIKLKLYSQYSQTFSFNKLSKSMKSFLKNIISQFDEELNKSQITNAYKKAERGR